MRNKPFICLQIVLTTLVLCALTAGTALADERSLVVLGDEEEQPVEVLDADAGIQAEEASDFLSQDENAALSSQAEGPSVSYQVHGQSYGWQPVVKDGATAGVVGRSKRLEAIRIDVSGIDARVEYSVHVQREGWQSWVSGNVVAGSTGSSMRLEAVMIRLVGSDADLYDIEYRAHVQRVGWQPWVRNEAMAGTVGKGLRVEAMEIRLVRRPKARVSYTGHVQNDGWQLEVSDGAISGTQGRALRMEAVTARIICGRGLGGGIAYRAHVQGKGWMPEVYDGAPCGTQGEAKRLEAIAMRLTGPLASEYDVWYRAHVQRLGWSAWACNDAEAGSTGLSLRMEALQIMLLPKGSDAPVSADAGMDVSCFRAAAVFYSTYVHGQGWQPETLNGGVSGTTGKGLQLEAFCARFGLPAQGSIQYRAHMQKTGWTNWQDAESSAGFAGEGRRMEAVEIRLVGAASKVYDVWYRVHVQKFGWMGWACNGASAGTSTIGYRTEALQIQLRPKGTGAPGSTVRPFTNSLRHERLVLIGDSRTVGMYDALYSQENYDVHVADRAGNIWSARVGAGYDWMVSLGVPRVENSIGADTAVVILLGVNDITIDFSAVNRYASYINAKADNWARRGASVYFAAISPVGMRTGVDSITDATGVTSNSGNVAWWNATLRKGLSANVQYLDTFNAIVSNYKTADGLHYDNDTSRRLYSYIKENAI